VEILHPRCAGLDVHKKTVVACARIAEDGRVRREQQSFGTFTSELIALAEWLLGHGVTHVAMEATGVYWKPVWHVLEGTGLQLLLANASRVKNVPGRKSDVSDAAWLADLLAHGLIPASFVPEQPIQELRGLTRMRKQLAREVAQHSLRIQKTLEDANIKLASVISDVLGKSGRAMLDALVAGEVDPQKLAALARPGIKAAPEELTEALRGQVTDYHRFELKMHLRIIDELRRAVAEVDHKIEEALRPFRVEADRVMALPGIAKTTAQVVVAEIGADMSRFPNHHHLLSWARMTPRMDESAGKKRSTRTQKGQVWLKTALVQAAWSAVKVKHSYFRAQFLRLKGRRGPKKAIVAVAASMLTAIYHVLKRGEDYRDLGVGFFDKRDRTKAARRHVRRLKELGFTVELSEPAAA
jgi:transposase